MNLKDPHDVLARTAWGEARGDGRPGMEAVMAVVMNRAANPRWWGGDVLSVCLAPMQFSCWNSNDPNLPKLRVVDTTDHQFMVALPLAVMAIAGGLPDPTGGADSYYEIGTPEPSWAVKATHTCDILGHRFYRVELPAPKAATTAPETDADKLNDASLAAHQQGT